MTLIPQQPGIPLLANPLNTTPIAGAGPITSAGGAPPTPAPAAQTTPMAPTQSQPTIDPQVPQLIQSARAQGVPDDQIFNFLHQQGMIPQDTTTPSQDNASLHDTGSFLGNLGNSALNFGKSLGNVILHPFDTAQNLGELGLGAINNNQTLHDALSMLPGLTAATDAISNDPAVKAKADQVYQGAKQYLSQRYGSWDAVKTTAYQDPVGFLADLSTVADAGGSALAGVGDISKVSELSDVGNTVSEAGKLANPVNAVTKPIEAVGSLVGAGLSHLGPAIEESNLRMTPAQRVAYADKLEPITKYINDSIPIGSPEARHTAAVNEINNFENKLQDWLQTDAKGVTASKKDLLDYVETLKSNFGGERDALEIDRQIDGFKKLIEEKYPDQIPVADLNNLKRSTFSNAYNNAGTKVSDAVEYELADTLYTGIKNATKGLPGPKDYANIEDFNKAYGIRINAEKLLKTAMGRPQLGFVERLLGDAIGLGSGGPFGAIGAHVLENTAPITATKSVIGKAAKNISKAIPKIRVSPGLARTTNIVSRVSAATNGRAAGQ